MRDRRPASPSLFRASPQSWSWSDRAKVGWGGSGSRGARATPRSATV